MSFSIEFYAHPLTYPYDDPQTPAAEGFLDMGGDREGFLSSLYEWSMEDYRLQWRSAVSHLIDRGGSVGLVTSYVSPAHASHLEWWVLRRFGDRVVITSQVLFYDQIPGEFSLNLIYEYAALAANDLSPSEGVSEWEVSVFDLERFEKMVGN